LIVSKFDDVIHAPNRLQICALLDLTEELEFKVLREHLDVSDSVLSKHIKVLETSGYVQLTKRTSLKRLRTWLKITPAGRTSYLMHVTELKKIVGI